MSVYCRLIRANTQAVCACDCISKVKEGKYLEDHQRNTIRCKSCGHELGNPRDSIDKLVQNISDFRMRQKTDPQLDFEQVFKDAISFRDV